MRNGFDGNRSSAEIWAYEMYFDGAIPLKADIDCVPLSENRFEEYLLLYNECFYPMRRSLDIRPYNWYSDISQIAERADDVFLLIENGRIEGSVACCGNEIDDLIVRHSERGRGYGKKLLLWAMDHIRKSGHREIVLHVAERNQAAVNMYRRAGFVIRKRERVR